MDRYNMHKSGKMDSSLHGHSLHWQPWPFQPSHLGHTHIGCAPQDLDQQGPGTGCQPSCAQLAVTWRSWQVACWSSSAGFGSSQPLQESQETLQSAERWGSARWDGARRLQARTCHSLGPTTYRARAESPRGGKAWAGTKAPLPPPQPLPNPRRQR